MNFHPFAHLETKYWPKHVHLEMSLRIQVIYKSLHSNKIAINIKYL